MTQARPRRRSTPGSFVLAGTTALAVLALACGSSDDESALPATPPGGAGAGTGGAGTGGAGTGGVSAGGASGANTGGSSAGSAGSAGGASAGAGGSPAPAGAAGAAGVAGGVAGSGGAQGGAPPGGNSAAFFVATDGDDAWSGRKHVPVGSSDGPFRTIGRALEALHAQSAEIRAGGVSVYIRAGTYFLAAPLVLTDQASGSPQHPTVLRSYPGERAVVSGGVEVTGWTPRPDSPDPDVVWAPSGLAAAELGSRFSTLRLRGAGPGEGTWASQARWPKKTGEIDNPEWQNSAFWAYARGVPVGGPFNASTQFLSIPLQLADHASLATWDLSSAQIVFFPLTYTVYNLPVAQLGGGADPSLLVFTGPYGPTTYLPDGMRFALSNIPQAISAPHEWSLDRATGQVSLKQASGETLGEHAVVVSRHTSLLSVQGTEAARVHDVVVEGLVFADASYASDDHFPATTADAAVDVAFADDIVVRRNLLEFLGGSGLRVRSTSRRVTVDENVFAHIGQAAVELVSWTPTQAHDASLAPSAVTIRGNYLTDVNHFGKLGAVYVYSATGSLIEGNLIHRAGGTGIQLLGVPSSVSRDNQVLFNDVHTVNYAVADGGGIYLTGNDLSLHANEVRGNRVLNVQGAYSDKGQFLSPAGGIGIYLDNGESGDTIQGNIVANACTAALMNHGGSHDTIISNLLLDGGDQEMIMASIEGSTMSDNLMFSNLIGVTPGNFFAPNALWRMALHPGDAYASTVATGGNVFTAVDAEAIRTADNSSPVVFFRDVTGNSTATSYASWNALGMDTNSTLVGPTGQLLTDAAGHVSDLAPGSLSASGIGPPPGLVTGLAHHVATRLPGTPEGACLLALLDPSLYAIPATTMPDPEAVFQCLRTP